MVDYDNELKKRVDMDLIYLNKQINDIDNEKRVISVKYTRIYKLIGNLPKDIQVKIYVFAMKKYWKDRLLNNDTFLPLYVKYNQKLISYQRNELFNNIHFLHLDCNTLPENKKYILGCQCDYCISYPQSTKRDIYNTVNGDIYKFLDTINCTGDELGNGVIPFNYSEDPEYISYVNNYNINLDQSV